MSEPLLVLRDGPVTELILNRPDRSNALSRDLVEALIEATEAASRDRIRLLVLRGEGKVFCGGFDFSGLDRQTDGDLVLRLIRIELLLQTIHHAPFATLALCHGGAYGAGADLVCACDCGVAAPGTRFRMPGLRFGIALGTRRLAERIGEAAAIGILTASQTFDAERALALGLVERIAERQGWAAVIAEMRDRESLEPEAKARLKSCVRQDRREADLASLVRSASAPGLKARIATFRAESARGAL